MGETTQIEWAESTINFYWGCTKVSEGCKFCYMYRNSPRYNRDATKVTKLNFDNIEKNLNKWSPRRIFVNSNSDTFHDSLSYENICEMFHLMLKYPKHEYMILTKRSGRMRSIFSQESLPNNFWLGVSVENQNHVDRIDDLLECDCYNKFLSLEPLLGDVQPDRDLRDIRLAIIGGESYLKNDDGRIMKEEWVDKIKEWCDFFEIPFFFKQWGGNSKCNCHNAWGCRLYKGQTWDYIPKPKTDEQQKVGSE